MELLRLSRVVVLAACAVLIAVATVMPAVAQKGAAPTEYRVKAVFLFNFAQFVEWPEAAFDEPQTPFVIGVLGTDPFGEELDQVVRSERVDEHPLVVERYATLEDVRTCHILFISQSHAGQREQISALLKDKPVLTVSDLQKPDAGTIIQFVAQRSRIGLRINVEAARAAGLTISSKLLRPAQVVGS